MLCCLYDVCITRLMTLTKSPGVVVDGEQGIVFCFPSKADNCYNLSNRDRCGGGSRTDRTPMFHFII